MGGCETDGDVGSVTGSHGLLAGVRGGRSVGRNRVRKGSERGQKAVDLGSVWGQFSAPRSTCRGTLTMSLNELTAKCPSDAPPIQKNDDGRAVTRPSSDATAVKRDGVIWAPNKANTRL